MCDDDVWCSVRREEIRMIRADWLPVWLGEKRKIHTCDGIKNTVCIEGSHPDVECAEEFVEMFYFKPLTRDARKSAKSNWALDCCSNTNIWSVREWILQESGGSHRARRAVVSWLQVWIRWYKNGEKKANSYDDGTAASRNETKILNDIVCLHGENNRQWNIYKLDFRVALDCALAYLPRDATRICMMTMTLFFFAYRVLATIVSSDAAALWRSIHDNNVIVDVEHQRKLIVHRNG